jgi:hypothetical protein
MNHRMMTDQELQREAEHLAAIAEADAADHAAEYEAELAEAREAELAEAIEDEDELEDEDA